VATDEQPASRLIDSLSEGWKKLYEQSKEDAVFAPATPDYDAKYNAEVTRKAYYRKLFGPRFVDATFDTYRVDPFNERQQFALDVCKSYAANISVMHQAERNNLVLAGKSGTGKNHLAYSIARAAVQAGLNVDIIPFLHIMQEIKASYALKNDTERNILDRYIASDLLLLEEIGVSYETSAEKIHLFDILDGRYKYSRPTIIITNYSEDEFRKFVDFDGKERVWDRLQQTAVIVPFDWESYRVG
jgi:DNA replication protein DnaC